MKALVTGATGLIGSHLVHALVAARHEVRCLVRQTSRRASLEALPVTWIVGDLLNDGKVLDAACGECDVAFHTAAHYAYGGVSPTEMLDTAVAGTEALLRACGRQGVRTVVVTSSSVVFGYSNSGEIICERDPMTNSDREPTYVIAKIAQHHQALKLAEHLGLDVRFACPTVTLGPTSSRLGPSNGLIVSDLTDPFSSTFPGGCNLVSASDVAEGHLLIALNGKMRECYLLGSENLTWRQIHGMIADLAGVSPPLAELSHVSAFLAAATEEIFASMAGRAAVSTRQQATMIGRYYWYSHAKAAALGYAPTTARTALTETISWLVSSSHITREVRARMHLSRDIYRLRSVTERQH